MASNVFGAPIEISEKTLKALQALPGDAQLQEIVLKRRDRALVAMDLMCTGDKYDDTHSFLQALQSNSGVGVSTPVLFYNASGAVINLVQNHDYCGHIGASPYPITVHNGQWGAFLHVTASGASTGASASSAAVVYRGLDAIGNSVDWCFAWDTPSNKVYTEVCEGGHYDSGACWGDIQGLLGKHGSICKENAADGQGFESSISTSDGTSPVVEAVLHLSFV